MRIFAIGDLHLPGGDDKPMNVFGSHWDNHFERISEAWRAMIGQEDLVLIPGDISWAMQLEQAVGDLQAVASLPGRKVIIRGNHDYWWSTIAKVRKALPESISAIQNDAMVAGNIVVCGTRGWTIPTGGEKLTEEDEKIFRRELSRFEMSIQSAKKIAAGRPVIAMLHYPPLYQNERNSEFTALAEKYGVSAVVYGHLHGQSIRYAFSGEHCGVQYRLCSCDALEFCPLEIII